MVVYFDVYDFIDEINRDLMISLEDNFIGARPLIDMVIFHYPKDKNGVWDTIAAHYPESYSRLKTHEYAALGSIISEIQIAIDRYVVIAMDLLRDKAIRGCDYVSGYFKNHYLYLEFRGA